MHLADTAKILIVDDMLAMLVAVRRAVVQLGYKTVLEATDGTEALATLAANPDVALVISDWNMEPMDGLDFLRAVRAAPHFKTLPFILMSAEATPALETKARAAGVSAVLQKPFDAERLRRTVAELADI